MNIELKNIYVNQRMSRETTLFEANLYINGVKVGYAENDGQGGSTNYRATTEEGRALIKEAEKYCKTLPDKIVPYDNDGKKETFTIKMSLEQKIDDLVDEFIVAYDKKQSENRFDKKMAKDMENGILIGVPGQRAYTVQKYNQPISKILETPHYRAALKTSIASKILPSMEDGFKILNTNIHAEDLRMLGVPEKYINVPAKEVKRKPTGPRAKAAAAKKKNGKKP